MDPNEKNNQEEEILKAETADEADSAQSGVMSEAPDEAIGTQNDTTSGTDAQEAPTEPEFEHEEGEVCLSGPLRFRDLFAFRLKYSYFSINGAAYWIITVLILACLLMNWNNYEIKTKVLLFVLLGIMVIYLPGNAALRTLQYTTMLKAEGITVTYVVNRNGILVTQGEQKEVLGWDMIRKVKETGKRFYLYVMKNSAFVFGKDLLGDQTEALRGYLKGAGKM